MKRIGIVGSRRRNTNADYAAVHNELNSHYEAGDWLVSGGCPQGADNFAEKIAKAQGYPILIFYPDWKGVGKYAGFKRNTDIALNSDILIACVAEDRTGGTEDTVKKFIARNGEGNLFLV